VGERVVHRGWRRRGAGGRRVAHPQPSRPPPQLLLPGELAPGVTLATLAARRAALAAALPPGGVALLSSTPPAFVAGVIPHPHRPDPDLAHYTGLAQPGCVAAVVRGGGGDGGSGGASVSIFVPTPDGARAVWDGAPADVAAAVAVFGADDAHPMREVRGGEGGERVASPRVPARPARPRPSTPSQLHDRLAPLLDAAPLVLLDDDRALDPGLATAPALARARAAARVRALRPATHALRWVKSPAELALMARSAALAADGMRAAMAASVAAGATEARVASAFEASVKHGGAARLAYPPVVASGDDAVTIHYSRNDKRVAQGRGGRMLMDAGCDLWGYASDVTRTWPTGPAFEGALGDVYDAVEAVHARLVAAAVPGATLDALHTLSRSLLAAAAVDLGAFPGLSPAAVAAGPLRAVYPHAVGHWLGRDVHDCGTVPGSTPLVPGAVLAVEPGLYFPRGAGGRFGRLAGVGVRLEDVVSISPRGTPATRLSAGAPLARAEVEAVMRAAVEAAAAG